ncbi:unnamed protein product [Clonostachys rhizophaga]|uniref:Uncharacterized protein n=1 Tax=Clonostachys rhizophaga TaxID=160324 RepID=A0A9N9YA79_9HYPO|nr:unnamed protein product [Clonostachys rhizophaga]
MPRIKRNTMNTPTKSAVEESPRPSSHTPSKSGNAPASSSNRKSTEEQNDELKSNLTQAHTDKRKRISEELLAPQSSTKRVRERCPWNRLSYRLPKCPPRYLGDGDEEQWQTAMRRYRLYEKAAARLSTILKPGQEQASNA